jgi:alkylhydroperoxidase family enzyme
VSEAKIQALKEPGTRRRDDVYSALELAVLRFTDLVGTYPGNAQPSDLDDLGAHLDQEQVFDLVLAIATATWTATMNDGLQTPVPS